ncbi:MAG: GNAT family N-acetyltransferase [Emcibacteraceae bacterium]
MGGTVMVDVKPIGKNEYDDWYRLWQGYLKFYNASLSDDISKNNWRRFHDAAEPVYALGAYREGTLVGFVHYLFHRTNWSLNDGCYLQDLYAAPAARGTGVGRALIEAVYDAAKKNKSATVYWLTQEDNKTARLLYNRIGGVSGFVHYEKLL